MSWDGCKILFLREYTILLCQNFVTVRNEVVTWLVTFSLETFSVAVMTMLELLFFVNLNLVNNKVSTVAVRSCYRWQRDRRTWTVSCQLAEKSVLARYVCCLLCFQQKQGTVDCWSDFHCRQGGCLQKSTFTVHLPLFNSLFGVTPKLRTWKFGTKNLETLGYCGIWTVKHTFDILNHSGHASHVS